MIHGLDIKVYDVASRVVKSFNNQVTTNQN